MFKRGRTNKKKIRKQKNNTQRFLSLSKLTHSILFLSRPPSPSQLPSPAFRLKKRKEEEKEEEEEEKKKIDW